MGIIYFLGKIYFSIAIKATEIGQGTFLAKKEILPLILSFKGFA